MTDFQQEGNRLFWTNPVTVILSVIVLFLVSQLLATAVVSLLLPLIVGQNYQTVIYVGANLVASVLLISVAKTVLKFSWKSLGVQPVSVQSYMRIIPVALMYIAFSTLATYLATKFIPGFDVDQVQNVGLSSSVSGPELVVAFVSLVILTPIAEELIFRGLLFRTLRKTIKISFIPLAIIIASLSLGGALMVKKLELPGISELALPLLFMVFALLVVTLGLVLDYTLRSSASYQKMRGSVHKRDPTFWSAALVTSLLFAVAHMQWNVAVDTFVLSLALCYLVEKSGSIFPAIALHALKNSIAFCILFVIK